MEMEPQQAVSTPLGSNITGADIYYDASASGSSDPNAIKDVDVTMHSDQEEDPMDDEDPYDPYDENYQDYDDDNDGDLYYAISDDEKPDNFKIMAAEFDDIDLPPGVEATVTWLKNNSSEKKSSESVSEVVQRYKDIKQFDTVTDYSDHHFAAKGNKKPSKNWVKRIQHEWTLLEQDLPSSILVRVYEERMDLLRAVIVGPFGTPYHDGLFFFDAQFPSDYPSSPPSMHYHSGGLRLNPNLYNCGKVCLSLLGTWIGSGCEKWNATKSSILQVLLSIQALVLNEKPYFNEPGFASSAGTSPGERKSLAYNQDVFLLSCKTMTYTLRRPPKNFEDYVARHFRERGRIILIACLSYLKDRQVGSKLENKVPEVDINDCNILTSRFKQTLKSLYDDLLMEFTVKGADCDPFLAKKVKKSGAARIQN